MRRKKYGFKKKGRKSFSTRGKSKRGMRQPRPGRIGFRM